MIAKKTIGAWLMVFFGLLISIFFLDGPIAIFCKRMARSSRSLAILMGDMPDLLLPVAGLATVLAWIGYGILRRRGINNNYTQFFKLTAVTIPVSYAVKSVLKYVFGRVETRHWLRHPVSLGFHFFTGNGDLSGFPSGHMTVFTVVVAAAYVYLPRYRWVYVGLLASLAILLIVTDYHFLSDVIAGTWLGILVHLATANALSLDAPFPVGAE
jgi:membrane-associated phospholipid phosphatase